MSNGLPQGPPLSASAATSGRRHRAYKYHIARQSIGAFKNTNEKKVLYADKVHNKHNTFSGLILSSRLRDAQRSRCSRYLP
jgi:hypothetical protein